MLASPTVKKQPITSEMLSDMVQVCQPDPSLGDLRLMAAYLLGFAAFLRYDELSKLRCDDLTFTANFLEIKIRSSKTDQYRQGDTISGSYRQANLSRQYGRALYGNRRASGQVWIAASPTYEQWEEA